MLFYLMNLGADFQQAEVEAMKIARRFDVADLLERDIHELSGVKNKK